MGPKAPNPRRIIVFFAQKMLRLSGLAARNFFVFISFSGFKIKSSTFSSLQEESSDSDQKYSSIWRTCTTVSGVQTDLIGCTTGLVVHVRQKITSTPLSIGCTTAFGVLAYYS